MNTKKSDYYSYIHSFGRWSTLVALVLLFLVPIGTMFYFKVDVNWSAVFTAAMQLAIIFIPTQLTEVLSFSPILGSGGTYLSFITGNVMNMKLPAATSGHRLLDVEPHSEEGEVVSVLAIGVSSITTTIIVFLGLFILAPLAPILEAPSLQPAFASVMPALMGTMLLPKLLKVPNLAIVPIVLATLAGLFVPSYGLNQGYIMLGVMILAVAINTLLVKKK